jgi:hypothetical protein
MSVGRSSTAGTGQDGFDGFDGNGDARARRTEASRLSNGNLGRARRRLVYFST